MPSAARDHAEFMERFWARVDTRGSCWEWTGALTTAGYGSVKHQQRVLYTHVVSFEQAHGPVPQGSCVCHTCDNRRCVNPAHFFLGSRGDNIRDAAGKNRVQYGEDRPAARLTEADVLAIRSEYARGGTTQRALAVNYGVSQMTISKAVRGETWTRV